MTVLQMLNGQSINVSRFTSFMSIMILLIVSVSKWLLSLLGAHNIFRALLNTPPLTLELDAHYLLHMISQNDYKIFVQWRPDQHNLLLDYIRLMNRTWSASTSKSLCYFSVTELRTTRWCSTQYCTVHITWSAYDISGDKLAVCQKLDRFVVCQRLSKIYQIQ